MPFHTCIWFNVGHVCLPMIGLWKRTQTRFRRRQGPSRHARLPISGASTKAGGLSVLSQSTPPWVERRFFLCPECRSRQAALRCHDTIRGFKCQSAFNSLLSNLPKNTKSLHTLLLLSGNRTRKFDPVDIRNTSSAGPSPPYIFCLTCGSWPHTPGRNARGTTLEQVMERQAMVARDVT